MSSLLIPVVYGTTHGAILGNQGQVAPFIAVVVFITAFSTVGALVASKRPFNPIGWLLCASGLCYSAGNIAVFLSDAAKSSPYGPWIGSWVWGLGLGLTATFVLLLFPTGRLPSPRWRPVAWIAGAGIATFVLGSALSPGRISGSTSTLTNPFGIGGPVGAVLRLLRGGFAVILLAALASIVSVVIRFRRAQSLEREQLKWLVFAAGLIVVAIIGQIPIESALGPSELATNLENGLASLALSFVPIAVGIAILKYRLYDIDVVINKTVVFGALAAFITAVYVGIVVGLGATIGGGTSKPNLGLSILATAVVAVAFQPVRERVQRFANRLVYGKRATPYEVLAGFVQRVAGTYAAEDVLPRMARALAEGTGAMRATVWLKVGGDLRPDAFWPSQETPPLAALPMAGEELPAVPDATLLLPVRYRGQLLGALSLTKRPGETLTANEDKLARDLAGQAGLVLRNVALTEDLLASLRDLEVSRSRMVSAEEEERQRLEGRIEDGARRELEATAIALDGIPQLLQGDDREGAVRELGGVSERATRALESLRDVARGVYPPLLADQGLVAALEAQARRATTPTHVDASGLRRHDQDVEAAVYFCCLEAMQNALRHAGASSLNVRVHERDDAITFEVSDDGTGFDGDGVRRGLGLTGMADRVSALGGELEVHSQPGGGTSVGGWVPLWVREPVS